MIVAGYQADLLPYSGFWHKMAKADLFDLKIYDQFQQRGYQKRVMMRGQWGSLQVIGNPSHARICDVRIIPDQTRHLLVNLINGRLSGREELGPVRSVDPANGQRDPYRRALAVESVAHPWRPRPSRYQDSDRDSPAARRSGCQRSGQRSYFRGAVGKVAFFNYELSATRIKSHNAAMFG